MVVGPTGGGKSSNVRTLQRALTMLKNEGIEGIKYEKVDIHHLNPKSITMGQLCARRVLRCFHLVDATRVRLTTPGVVSLSSRDAVRTGSLKAQRPSLMETSHTNKASAPGRRDTAAGTACSIPIL